MTVIPIDLRPSLPSLSSPDRDGGVEEVVVGSTTLLVARTRGFCWGVDRALRIARETVERFRDRRVLLTSSILHNPRINSELADAGVRFLDREPELWSEIGDRDVVLLPAFGVSPATRARLEGTGAFVVDTTCGSVAFVWKHVDGLAADGYTIVYHGRRGHEEARATLDRLPMLSSSEAERVHPHVIVSDREEANALLDWLDGRRPFDEVLRQLPDVFSAGFAADADRNRIGFANQTTMLSSESEEISRRLAESQARAFPNAPLGEHFRTQDTICGATDERQTALRELLALSPDLVVVVGGFDSSNTAHLAEMAAAAGIPSYHVEDARDIRPDHVVRHRDPITGELVSTRRAFHRKSLTIGVSSGASTPEENLRAVLERIALLTRKVDRA